MSSPRKHPTNKQKMSANPTEPLQRYFDCLSSFALRGLKNVDRTTGLDLSLVKNLMEQGCLTGVNSSTHDGLSFLDVSITPQGAIVLAEWSALLRANSFKGQFMDVVGKIVWLLAGMVITLSGALLLKIIDNF